MSMPVLSHLWLSNGLDKLGANYITKVSALNKCTWSQLSVIDLCSYLTNEQ
jgi:hypothetical protein